MPAFAMTTSTLLMLHSDVNDATPLLIDSVDATSILMIKRRDPDALKSECRDWADKGSRTVAITVVLGFARYTVTRPLPIPVIE